MNDFETVRACVEGAARLGVEPFIDGPAALDRIEAEVERLRGHLDHFTKIREATQPRQVLQAEVERLRAALEPFIWTTTPVRAEENYTVHVRGSDILRGRAALAKEEA